MKQEVESAELKYAVAARAMVEATDVHKKAHNEVSVGPAETLPERKTAWRNAEIAQTAARDALREAAEIYREARYVVVELGHIEIALADARATVGAWETLAGRDAAVLAFARDLMSLRKQRNAEDYAEIDREIAL